MIKNILYFCFSEKFEDLSAILSHKIRIWLVFFINLFKLIFNFFGWIFLFLLIFLHQDFFIFFYFWLLIIKLFWNFFRMFVDIFDFFFVSVFLKIVIFQIVFIFIALDFLKLIKKLWKNYIIHYFINQKLTNWSHLYRKFSLFYILLKIVRFTF